MGNTIIGLSSIVSGIAALIWIADREKLFIQKTRRRFNEWRRRKRRHKEGASDT
jgi:hypothetical protein